MHFIRKQQLIGPEFQNRKFEKESQYVAAYLAVDLSKTAS